MVQKTTIPEATGASIRPDMLAKKTHFYITDFGASTDAAAQTNTRAINEAVKKASSVMGGTVVIPEGTFYTYTIRLQSNVNLFLEEGAVIAAAMTDISDAHETQHSEGGNYDEPEVNPYVGLQDHGHSYFANSLVYGADLENIMIYGKGLFTGGRFDEESGLLTYVLQGADPAEPDSRGANGHRGAWFGNKGLALVRCRNIVFQDFSVTIGGHFAIIAEGCDNLYVEHILIDTTRDAFDIDCCQNVTVRDTVCNSLTDDALCVKASFGAGQFCPARNILIEDCVVSGYDAGSVYAGSYTRDKLAAQDRCGPTGRVKLGTESSCGYHQVTVRRVRFDRSRGFALEAVDCSALTDIIFTDCTMDNVSSSPIFIRAGDRGRFPVTGHSAQEIYPCGAGDVRLDNQGWILPNSADYHYYPAKRYAPHYNRTKRVTVDGHSYFDIVDGANPTALNEANYTEREGKYYPKRQSEAAHGYETDFSKEIRAADLPLYANAVGCETLARVENVYIGNVTITNADPRYPILLMGLTDSHLKNITLENISVEYRGGLTMAQAVEQRQLNTDWKYSQFHARTQVQSLPWLVNTFFLKNEGLLPRAEWDAAQGAWVDDPYNIPELPEVYPEPSNWGILPAYGIFARHVDALTLRSITVSCKVPDERHVCVLDDAHTVCIEGLRADSHSDCVRNPNVPAAPIVTVTNRFRRHTNAENVPEQPYFTTTVTHLQTDDPSAVAAVEVNAPAPGTPQDSLYPYPTVPCADTGYRFAIATDDYPLPLTVHRPYICPLAPITAVAGETVTLALTVRNPATDISDEADDGIIYNERGASNYGVRGACVSLRLSCAELPAGASFDAKKREFRWTPAANQCGEYRIPFIADDGVIPERTEVVLRIVPSHGLPL
ncbi:MAG: hypothetical protein NC337_07530 [Roseburia sp.]|nr:hypothetical protein [Roseburia sp.]